ncbi:MAG: hypothetical protein E7481_01690 [Ruminococcaceae bacterium]|nr:hypothetical protein [Oscillospiraceae bacterium]
MLKSDISVKINPLTYIVWLFLLYFGQAQFMLCSFVCASLHEAAHIAAYLSCGASVLSLEILPFGISASVGKTDRLTCKDEILCAFCGPLMNLVLSAIFILMSESFIKGADYFIYCNFAFFVLNMLPVIPLDGGRILYFVLLLKFKLRTCSVVIKTISCILTAVIIVLGFYIYYTTGYNVSVLLIGMYLFLYIFTSLDSF